MLRRKLVFISLIWVFWACKKDRGIAKPTQLNIYNIVDTGASMNWGAVSGATAYSVFVATDTNFNHLVGAYAPAVVTDPSIVLSVLTPYTKYFVMVKATIGSDSSGGVRGDFTTSDADQLVFVGSDDYNVGGMGGPGSTIANRLYALNARDGSVAWTYPTGWSVDGSPVVVGDSVYFATDNGYVYSLNLQGNLNWQFGPSYSGAGFESTPVVNGGSVFIADDGGWLYKLDARTGIYQWTTGSYGYTKVNSSVIFNDSATTIYVAGEDGRLYAVYPLTGAIKWGSANTGGPFVSKPVLANGTVYVGNFFRLYAFDATTGATKWNTANSSVIEFSSCPVVSNNKVLIGGGDGNFYSFNAADGSVNWMTLLGSSIESSPVVLAGVIYVASNGIAYALDEASGKIIWQNDNIGSINGVIYSGPTVTNSHVYIGSVFGTLYCLNRFTGQTLWASSPSDAGFHSSPCVRSYSGTVAYPGVAGMK